MKGKLIPRLVILVLASLIVQYLNFHASLYGG